MSMHRDGGWSYGPPLSRACWTPSQVAEGRHVAVWDPGPSAQALARPYLRYRLGAALQQFARPEASQSFLFALQWTIVTMLSTNVTIYHHLISQAGWNRCKLSIYFSQTIPTLHPSKHLRYLLSRQRPLCITHQLRMLIQALKPLSKHLRYLH